MITMEDISLELGVSINTVSKALNNKPDVSPKTRKLVLDTARRMGYVPNALAKSLVTKSSGTLGIVVPSVTVTVYAELVEYIMKSASKMGYTTFLALSSDDEQDEVAAIESLYQKRVDGLVVIPAETHPSYHEAMVAFKQPIVYVYNTVDLNDAYFVGQRLEECAYIVTQHLIAQGCKKLALLCSTRTGIASGVERGYRKCLEENGFDPESGIVICPESSLSVRDSGFEVSKMLDEKIDELDGVVLENEELYFGLNNLAENHGISIPGDLLVAAAIGYGVKRSPFMSLTSIEIDPEEIGKEALECLTDQIKNGDEAQKREPLRGKLVIRKSSRRK